jgi:HNH endonuclease
MKYTRERHLAVFWANVDKTAPGGCWLWRGCLDSWERGVMTWNYKRVFAHRLSWELAYGPPLKGLFICHTCDIRACVNPLHLFLGTASDNNWDRARKFRTGKIKLTPSWVREIRKLFGAIPQKDIAKRYGVSDGVISGIKVGRTYTHVED